MAYPNLNGDPKMMKITIKDDEMKTKKKTEKHDCESILKSKIQNVFWKKNYEYLNRKIIFLNFSDKLTVSSSTLVSSTLPIIISSITIPIASSSTLIASIAILSTNIGFQKLKHNIVC